MTHMGRSATKSFFATFLGILAVLVLLPSSAKAQSCNPPSVFATPILGSPGGCPLVVEYVAPLYSNGNISAVAVADFNGDGKMDVAMALNGGNDNYAVAVLLGNGDGTFSGPFFSAPCCSPDLRGVNWVVAGDFNGDGKADVAIGTSDGFAAILLGNGDGTFTLKSYWGVTPCCSGPQAGAVGDFNGDGNLDLLVTTANVTSPGVAYFYPGNGDGTFNTNSPLVIAVGSSQNRPVSIAVGDFNHDGHLDFATMNNAGGGPNTVSVVLGNGDGTFQPAVDYALLNPGRGDGVTDSVSIVAGDFNGDGYLDLATLDKLNSGVSVLLNNGDGTFKAPVIYGSAVPWNNGLYPQQIAVGDFNHDGYLDIVFIASQQGAAAVLFGNGDGTFKPAVTYVTDVNPDTVAVGDFNGDGIADFVVGTNYNEGITIALSHGDGTFKGARSYVPWIISNSFYGWGNGGPNPVSVAFGDFNGDGKPDLAVADGNNVNVTIFANNGTGSFTESANYRTTLTQFAYQPTLVRVADLNRDGKLDLVVGGGGNSFGTMLGNGDGTFQPPLLYSSGLGRASSLAFADVNGDGIPDVIFNSPDGYYNAPPGTQETAYVALGNGDGTFQAPLATLAFCVPWGPVQYVAVVDLNGDGKPDLAATCAPDGNNNRPTTIFVLLGHGDGTFGAASAIPANAFPTIIAAGDFNEDGKQDLVVGNNYPAPAQFSLLLGNGDGTFQNPVAYSVLPSWWTNPAPTPWPQTFAIADFNHDGHLDVLVGDYNGTVGDSATGLPYNQGVQLLLGNGDGTLQAPQLFLAGRKAYDMAVADLHGDGSADVAVADGFDSAVTILLNQVPSVRLQTTTALQSSLNPPAFGQTVTFTATVTPSSGSGTPTGTVTFMDGSSTLGSGSLDSANQATYSTSTLAVGTHSITAVYSGDTNFAQSTSAALSQVVNQASTTTSLQSSPNPSTFGQPVTFTATVAWSASGTPTGSVTFMDGGTTLGTSPLNSSGQATYTTSSLAVGTHSITASYGGDSDFTGSTSPALSQVISGISTTTSLQSSLNPSTFGQSVTFTATVAWSGSGTPTGTVGFYDGNVQLCNSPLDNTAHGSCTVSTLAAGSQLITASYSGDSDFQGSTSAAFNQSVNKASTTTSVASSLNPSIYLQSVTFTATITPQFGGIPTGTVNFKDGATLLCASPVDNSGHATCTTSTLTAGSHSITASFLGDSNLAGSTSSTLTQTINKSNTVTTLTSSLNPSKVKQTVTFTATVTPGIPTGKVQFYDGKKLLGTQSLVNGVAKFSTSSLSKGTHSLHATYGGDSNFNGSTSAVLSQVVQ